MLSQGIDFKRLLMIFAFTLDTGVLLTAISTLGGVVVFLFHKLHSEMKDRYHEVHIKLDECEEDRQGLWTELARLNDKPDPTAYKLEVQKRLVEKPVDAG